jgi:hypothetical protein
MNTPAGYCPVTKTLGKKIDRATIKALLSVSLRAVQEVQYYFCREANCEVVYFSEDGQQMFYTHDLRERVYQKEPANPDSLICYCFRHSLREIRHEWEATGTVTVIDDIHSGIQSGQCACDWRNPQGDCCLGNVQRFVKQLMTE